MTDRKSATMREFAVRFEHEHIEMFLKPGAADHYRSSQRLYILPALGGRPLDEIATADIQRLQNSLKLMPCAANSTRAVLSCLFTKAEEWDVSNRRNPTVRVKRFEERAVERFLSPEEREAVEKVLESAEHIPAGKAGHIGRDGIWAIRLLTLTGRRRGRAGRGRGLVAGGVARGGVHGVASAVGGLGGAGDEEEREWVRPHRATVSRAGEHGARVQVSMEVVGAERWT